MTKKKDYWARRSMSPREERMLDLEESPAAQLITAIMMFGGLIFGIIFLFF